MRERRDCMSDTNVRSKLDSALQLEQRFVITSGNEQRVSKCRGQNRRQRIELPRTPRLGHTRVESASCIEKLTIPLVCSRKLGLECDGFSIRRLCHIPVPGID